MKPVDMIQNNKYSNCADLDAPELFVIMNDKWARENETAIRSCKGVEDFNINLGWFLIPDANDRLLFAMKWP